MTPTIRQRFGSYQSAAAARRQTASRARSMTTQSYEDRMWAAEEAQARAGGWRPGRSLRGT